MLSRWTLLYLFANLSTWVAFLFYAGVPACRQLKLVGSTLLCLRANWWSRFLHPSGLLGSCLHIAKLFTTPYFWPAGLAYPAGLYILLSCFLTRHAGWGILLACWSNSGGIINLQDMQVQQARSVESCQPVWQFIVLANLLVDVPSWVAMLTCLAGWIVSTHLACGACLSCWLMFPPELLQQARSMRQPACLTS